MNSGNIAHSILAFLPEPLKSGFGSVTTNQQMRSYFLFTNLNAMNL